MVMEELVPKETGRDAALQKRAAKGSYARADKDAGGIDAGLSEKDLMGSGGASEYQAMYVRTRTTTFPLLSGSWVVVAEASGTAAPD